MAMRRSLLAAVQGRSSCALVPSLGGSPGSSAGRFLAPAHRLLSSPPSATAFARFSLARSGLSTSYGIRYYGRPPWTGRHLHNLSFWSKTSSGRRLCTKDEMEALKKSFHYLDEKCQGGLVRLSWYEKISWLWWSIYGSMIISLLLGLHKEQVDLNKLQEDVNQCKESKKTAAGVSPLSPAPVSPSSNTHGPDAPRAQMQAEAVENGGTASNPAAPGGRCT